MLADILKNLYQEIIITPEVQQEFNDDLTEWILVKNVQDVSRQHDIESKLDVGEASSIGLALETKKLHFDNR